MNSITSPRTLVIGLEGLPPEALLGDERLALVRFLMATGGYGRLDGEVPAEPAAFWRSLDAGLVDPPADAPALPALLADPEAPPLLEGDPGAGAGVVGADRLASLAKRMEGVSWTFARVIDATPTQLRAASGDWLPGLDTRIGPLLEQLGEAATVLILAHDGPAAGFVLAATGRGTPGELSGVHLVDLGPMLLALAGRPVPPSMTGRAPIPSPPAPARRLPTSTTSRRSWTGSGGSATSDGNVIA